MQNILFTPPSDQKILSGEKTLTSRYWKRKPPKVGAHVTASTGRKKETRFAVLRITGVYEWDGRIYDTNAKSVTGLSRQEIAKREGFGGTPRPKDSWLDDWDAFIEAYYSLNAEQFKDDDRNHYFIAFESLQKLEDGDYYCTGCGRKEPEQFYNWTYRKSPICDDCLVDNFHRKQRSPREGYY